MIIVLFLFFYGWTISPPRNKKTMFIMCQQEKNTWTSDTEYGGDFAVAMIPPGVDMGTFFLLTTVSTTVKSFGCKSSDKRYVSQQSAGTN